MTQMDRWPNWQHGALIGHAVRTYRTMSHARACQSASPRAKELAQQIEDLARELETELRTNKVKPKEQDK